MSDRSMPDDDLAQAYASAHALRDGQAGPAASVRANVLAAAAAVAAAQSQPTAATPVPPLTPVAGPVAAVVGDRDDAPNLSSWRVRSGAALCALLIVGVLGWRVMVPHQFGGTVVASVDSTIEAKALQEAPAPPGEPRDLPPPKPNLPPPRQYEPPAVVADVAEPTVVLAPPAALPRERDAAAASAESLARAAAPAQALGYRPPSAIAAPAAPAPAPAPAPVATPAPAPAPVSAQIAADKSAQNADAAEQRLAKASRPEPAPAAATAAAAAPPATLAAAAPPPETAGALGQAGAVPEPGYFNTPRGDSTADALRGAASAKRAAPAAMASAMGANPHAQTLPLHAAAAAGDADALRRLLADPAARVDATDSAGRTALAVAVVAHRPVAVRLLLAAGADPEHADVSGATPRSLAHTLARTGPAAEIAGMLGVVH